MSVETLTPLQAELLKRADEIFAAVGTAVGKASDIAFQAGQVVAAEIPDIAYQYIAFGRVYQTGIFVFTMTMALLGFYWFFNLGLNNRKNFADDPYCGWHGARIAYTTGGGLTTIIFGIISIANFRDTVLIWAAPKIWLIEELARIAKRATS